MQTLSSQQISAFRAAVWDYYQQHGRHDLPWREAESGGSFDPYKILVSEIMLQQTQVGRVIPKFQAFLRHYPNVRVLAKASLAEVLQAWSGLGYNRRAKFLWQAAQKIVQEYAAVFPEDAKSLQSLPGVGVSTAGAIIAYAFNQSVVFIETNIRSVFIHHFFQDQPSVRDREITSLMNQTLEPRQVRAWYWALMDYGSYLKKAVGNLNYASTSYYKQSPFRGSRRQIRGQVIRILLTGPLSGRQLATLVADPRLTGVLTELIAEGFVELEENHYRLSAH